MKFSAVLFCLVAVIAASLHFSVVRGNSADGGQRV